MRDWIPRRAAGAAGGGAGGVDDAGGRRSPGGNSCTSGAGADPLKPAMDFGSSFPRR